MGFREGSFAPEEYQYLEAQNPERKGNFLRRAKEYITIGLTAALISFHPELSPKSFLIEAAPRQQSSDTVKPEREKTEKFKKITEEEFLQTIDSDPVEQAAIQTNLDQAGEMYLLEDGNKTSGVIAFEDIEYFINKGAKKITLIHKHPRTSYEILFSPEEVENIRAGKKKVGPMPPSLLDLTGALDTLERFRNKTDVTFAFRTYDANGNQWEFSIGNSEFIKQYQKFNRDIKKLFENLPKSDIDLIKNSGDRDTDPRALLAIMQESQNPAVQALGERLQQQIETLVETYEATVEIATDFELTSAELAQIQGDTGKEPPKEWATTIARYLQGCKERGINMSHKKFK